VDLDYHQIPEHQKNLVDPEVLVDPGALVDLEVLE
jgi:hypothetical protein